MIHLTSFAKYQWFSGFFFRKLTKRFLEAVHSFPVQIIHILYIVNKIKTLSYLPLSPVSIVFLMELNFSFSHPEQFLVCQGGDRQ